MDSPSPSLLQVDRTILQQLAVKLLTRKGMFAAEAEIVADRMIEADLDHQFAAGIGSLADYLDAMDLGDIDPRARLITVTETAAVAVVDGSTGIGHVATSKAMLMAVDKAQVVGIGMVVLKNSRLGGDLGAVARLAADRGLIGMAMTGADDMDLGTSTIAWAASVSGQSRPVVMREQVRNMGAPLSLYCQLLAVGLAGAEPIPRKRKANRVANVVEHAVIAISPSQFGASEALAAKWAEKLSGRAMAEPTGLVSIRTSDAQVLSDLAAKIKFAVTW